MAEILPENQIFSLPKNTDVQSPSLPKPKNESESDNEGEIYEEVLSREVLNPIWLSISEAAKVGGVQGKTIRRALQGKALKYKIVGNRYLIDLASVIKYLHSTKKLKNKLMQNGMGQYITGWRK